MDIPTIKIGATTYDVVEVDGLHYMEDDRQVRLNGHILYDDCTINIEAALHEQRKRIAIVHEAIHGILENAAMNDHSEAMVDALAHGLVDVLQSNPKLLDLMRE